MAISKKGAFDKRRLCRQDLCSLNVLPDKNQHIEVQRRLPLNSC